MKINAAVTLKGCLSS